MRNIKLINIVFIAIFVFAVLSCDFLAQNSEYGTLVLQLPGSSLARSTAISPDDFECGLTYKVYCIQSGEDSGGEEYYLQADNVKPIFLLPGDWYVYIEVLGGYGKGPEAYKILGEGDNDENNVIKMEAGKTTPLAVTISVDTSIAAITEVVIYKNGKEFRGYPEEDEQKKIVTVRVPGFNEEQGEELEYSIKHTGAKLEINDSSSSGNWKSFNINDKTNFTSDEISLKCTAVNQEFNTEYTIKVETADMREDVWTYGNIISGGDEWFQFTVNQADTYYIHFYSDLGEDYPDKLKDVYIQLYDENKKNKIGSEKNLVFWNYAEYTLSEGTYSVRVYPYSKNDYGYYKIGFSTDKDTAYFD